MTFITKSRSFMFLNEWFVHVVYYTSHLVLNINSLIDNNEKYNISVDNVYTCVCVENLIGRINKCPLRVIKYECTFYSNYCSLKKCQDDNMIY